MLERESLATEIREGVANPRDEKITGLIMRGNGSRRVKNKMTDGDEFKGVKKQSDKRIISSDTELSKNYKRSRIGDVPGKELKILKAVQNTKKGRKNTDCR